MGWLVIALAYLLQKDKDSSSSSSKPIPVLTPGPSSGRLWLVRDNRDGTFDVATSSDVHVCQFRDAAGVRSLRSHPQVVNQKDLDAVILDFKLRVPTKGAS